VCEFVELIRKCHPHRTARDLASHARSETALD